MNLLTRLIIHIHARRSQRHTSGATPGAFSVAVITAVNDNARGSPPDDDQFDCYRTPLMLQTPTGLHQTAPRVQPNANRRPPMPPCPRPVLTQASLKAWQNADELTDEEKEQRGQLAKKIVKMVVPFASAGLYLSGLGIDGTLDLFNYPKLTQLPAGLHVSGNLYCSACPGLTQLPEGLSIGGNLDCRFCPGLTQLPEGLSVGGNLDCYRCTSLTSLPNDIASWGHRTHGGIRRINLTGTGITPNLRQQIERAELPGLQIDFGMAAAPPKNVRFANLDEAVAFWRQQAGGRTAPKLAGWQEVLPRDRALVRQFLGRLCDTADYQHTTARTRLASRVCDLLQAMDDSTTLRRLCSDCISNALQTCGDRVMWAMNQVETAVRVHQACNFVQVGAELKKLVLSFMRLDIVQAHARRKVTTLIWVDEIEVFLAFESGLREAPELPVSAENMLFARCAQVPPADLDAARQAAVSAMQDPEQVDAYLQASAPWQHHLRQQAAKQWSWQNLETKPWPKDLNPDQLQCGFTLRDFADLTQPILCPSGDTWQVYEAKDLLTHWVAHGTDIHRRKLELVALRRLPMPVGNAPTKLGG